MALRKWKTTVVWRLVWKSLNKLDSYFEANIFHAFPTMLSKGFNRPWLLLIKVADFSYLLKALGVFHILNELSGDSQEVYNAGSLKPSEINNIEKAIVNDMYGCKALLWLEKKSQHTMNLFHVVFYYQLVPATFLLEQGVWSKLPCAL